MQLNEEQIRRVVELTLKRRLESLNVARRNLCRAQHAAKELAGDATVVAIDAAIQQVANEFEELNALTARDSLVAKYEQVHAAASI